MFLLTSDSQFDPWIITHESWIRSDRHLPNDPQPYLLVNIVINNRKNIYEILLKAMFLQCKN